MLFRIRDDRVEKTDIFYGSEDFGNKLRQSGIHASP